MGALPQQPYRHRPRLAGPLTQPLDGKNVIAHPVARGIAQALRDKVLTPKETARHCAPKRITFDRRSTDLTQRSVNAFKFGLRAEEMAILPRFLVPSAPSRRE